VKPHLVLILALHPALAATLVENGRSAFSICIDAGASPAEKRAAAELQRFIQEMSGARLPIDSSCTAAQPYVFAGFSPALARVAPSLKPESFTEEEFVLRTAGRDLIIAGGRPRGVLYGVYSLLDRLGCRWFTSDVSRIPKQRTIRLADLNVREKPAFEYREVFFTEAFDRDWASRNRLNSSHANLDESTGGRVEYQPFVHSFYYLVPPDRYFREHPEYFSWIDGARRSERAQLCLTNPDVLRISVERVREWIQKYPKAKIFSVSQNDHEGWCECDRCLRMEREEGGTHSGPLLHFVNAVAAEIAKTNADKLIDTLAYWYTEDPPAHVRPLPNVRIRLCPIGVCEAHPYTQCTRSAYFARNLKAWNSITSQLYIWHYNTNFRHYLTPFPDFDELAADIPLYKRSGVVGLFLQGGYAKGGGAENAELRSYVMARQLWNPAVDVQREIDDFMAAVYGPAAGAMRRYHERLHREVRMPPAGAGQHIWIFNLPDFSRSFLDDAKAIFTHALSATADPAVRRRIERAALPVEYVELVQAGEYRVAGDTYAPVDLAGWKDRYQTFAGKLKTFGIESIREGAALDDDVKAAAAMRPYKVVHLENERRRVTLIPELGGRIFQITTKPDGQGLLWVPNPSSSRGPRF
jgi:hypothetical protein